MIMGPGTISTPRYLRSQQLEPLVAVELSESDLRLLHMAVSILLDYPTEERYAHFEQIEAEIQGLDPLVRDHLQRFLDHAREVGQYELAKTYVDTFDRKRRCSLYLSYFLTGDTRKRGSALVAFIEAMRAGGFEVARRELPDYLPLVLEFSALGDREIADSLLGAHREGIEVMRSALTSLDCPYTDLVSAISMSLPPITEEVREAYLQLITAGPPSEMVGATALGPLEPFRPAGAANMEVSQ